METVKVPIIDIFAGPGGLGEGFSSFKNAGNQYFKIGLSIEKEQSAHKTLELRSFYRQFTEGAPEEYYKYLRGEISRDVLFEAFPVQAAASRNEAWNATLGSPDFPPELIDGRIKTALRGASNWVLIGGPPCQAYSLAGRSRMAHDQEKHQKDEKHFLYREYLRIIQQHKPAVFVMENVKGLLSASIPGTTDHIFESIKKDLSEPGYKIYSLKVAPSGYNNEVPEYKSSSDYILKAEDYGVPQARHRVILLGLRTSTFKCGIPQVLQQAGTVSIEDVIGDMPKLRSKLSSDDSFKKWEEAVRDIPKDVPDPDFAQYLKKMSGWKKPKNSGKLYYPTVRYGSNKDTPLYDWYHDERLGGYLNHAARSHMREDIRRYFWASCFARYYKTSPRIKDFPRELLPAHKNVKKTNATIAFADRFKVQLKGYPSSTVVSHISKDGHYYIHYGPAQCRSLSVREAARLQTFPDNYFFEGNKTSQYQQVGNAVPPYLARQIAAVVHELMERSVK